MLNKSVVKAYWSIKHSLFLSTAHYYYFFSMKLLQSSKFKRLKGIQRKWKNGINSSDQWILQRWGKYCLWYEGKCLPKHL